MIAVQLKDSHKMIGNVYMGKREFEALEIGYVFNRNYWGHGYAAESCKALIQQAFSNGIHRVYAECDPRNKSSWKLLIINSSVSCVALPAAIFSQKCSILSCVCMTSVPNREFLFSPILSSIIIADTPIRSNERTV